MSMGLPIAANSLPNSGKLTEGTVAEVSMMRRVQNFAPTKIWGEKKLTALTPLHCCRPQLLQQRQIWCYKPLEGKYQEF